VAFDKRPHRSRKEEAEEVSIFKIILWAYLLGGEAVLLAIAFSICRKDVRKGRKYEQGDI
jgi:hypothetical protein